MTEFLPPFASEYLRFDGMFQNGLIDSYQSITWLFALLLVVWYMPNTQQLLARYRPALGYRPRKVTAYRRSWILWRPNYVWSVILAALGAMALVKMWIGGNAEFLYFQF